MHYRFIYFNIFLGWSLLLSSCYRNVDDLEKKIVGVYEIEYTHGTEILEFGDSKNYTQTYRPKDSDDDYTTNKGSWSIGPKGNAVFLMSALLFDDREGNAYDPPIRATLGLRIELIFGNLSLALDDEGALMFEPHL